jgi:hypothetical protein
MHQRIGLQLVVGAPLRGRVTCRACLRYHLSR